MDEVRRGQYMFDETRITFDYNAKIDVKSDLFRAYNERVRDSFNVYRQNQQYPLPRGTFRFNHEDTNHTISLIGLIITPESVLYPSEVSENQIYKLVAQAGLDVLLCRKDSLRNGVCSSVNADLSFSTETVRPTLTYWFNDSTIEIEAKDLKPDHTSYSWRNKGGISSLVDLREGIISFSQSDRILNELNQDAFRLSGGYNIFGFKLNILSRSFASFKLCRSGMVNYTIYHLKLPREILQTNLSLECQ
jgi:hypothetical protein